MVLIGKDLTREDILSSTIFLQEKSRAGKLTRDLLSKLEAIEQSVINTRISTSCIFTRDCFPLATCKVDEALLPKLLEFLRTSLALIKPTIVVTFSRLVTSCGMANSPSWPRYPDDLELSGYCRRSSHTVS